MDTFTYNILTFLLIIVAWVLFLIVLFAICDKLPKQINKITDDLCNAYELATRKSKKTI